MSKALGKTIQIFCPTGEPRGVRIAEITTSIVQAVVVPRAKLEEARERIELGRVGVYFLFGPQEGTDRWRVYIGEADDCCWRLGQHATDSQKDFWQIAIAIVSSKQSLTKAHGRLLEHWAVARARTAGRFDVVNGTAPGKPPVPEAMEAECEDVFQVAETLLSTLGFPVFESLRATGTTQHVFKCTQSGADAKGMYTEDGFVVFAGSFVRGEIAQSLRESLGPKRKALVEGGVLHPDGAGYRFLKDHLFNSPSAAAGMVMGSPVNGWDAWIDESSRTLDEVYRKAAAL